MLRGAARRRQALRWGSVAVRRGMTYVSVGLSRETPVFLHARGAARSMLTSDDTLQAGLQENVAGRADPVCDAAAELLRRGFGTDFAVIDGTSGELLREAAGQPDRDWGLHARCAARWPAADGSSSSTTSRRW